MNTQTRQGVVDRIEDGIAVIDLGDETEPVHLKRGQLPKKVKAGDHIQLTFEDDQVISITRDAAATEAARERIEAKVARLRRGEHLRPPKQDNDTGDNPPVEGDD